MIKINLLKEEITPARRKPAVPIKERQRNFLFFFVFLIALGAMGYMYWSLKNKLTDLNRNIRMAQEEMARLEEIIKKVNDYERDKDILDRKIDLIKELAKNRSTPVELMVELSNQIPKQLWLNSVSERAGQVTINGMAYSYNAIAEFDGNLAKSAYFTEGNVELLDAEELPDGIKRFALTCRFTKPPSESESKEKSE